jgi:hypothetical protein
MGGGGGGWWNGGKDKTVCEIVNIVQEISGYAIKHNTKKN